VPVGSLSATYGFADLDASAKLVIDCVEKEAFSLNTIPGLSDDAKMVVDRIVGCAHDVYFNHFVIPSLALEPPCCSNTSKSSLPVMDARTRSMNPSYGGGYPDSLDPDTPGRYSSGDPFEDPQHMLKQVSENVGIELMGIGAKFDSEVPPLGGHELSHKDFLNETHGGLPWELEQMSRTAFEI
jgi:hypothetical protein